MVRNAVAEWEKEQQFATVLGVHKSKAEHESEDSQYKVSIKRQKQSSPFKDYQIFQEENVICVFITENINKINQMNEQKKIIISLTNIST